MALSDHEAVRVFGGGSGDFYQRSIEISQGGGYEMPVIDTVRFLEDGAPVAIDGFDSADYSVSNATGTAPTKISDGVYEVGLTPNDQTSPAAMNLSVTGTGISTLFNEAFALTNSLVTYDVQPQVWTHLLVSYWAKGSPESFKIDASYAASVTTGSLPRGLEFNATTLLVWHP